MVRDAYLKYILSKKCAKFVYYLPRTVLGKLTAAGSDSGVPGHPSGVPPPKTNPRLRLWQSVGNFAAAESASACDTSRLDKH